MNNTQCILDALKIATDTKAFELGEGVLHRAPALFKEYFPNRKAVIVADNNTWKAAGEAVDASMREAGIPCERFLIEEEEFHADWPAPSYASADNSDFEEIVDDDDDLPF